MQVTYHPINLLTDTTYSARALNAWAAVLKNGTPLQALTLHDLFYENQPYETNADSTTNADIAKLVTRSGATNSAVTSALSVTDTAFLTAAQQAMVTAKVTGTPTIYLNGRELPAAAEQLIERRGQLCPRDVQRGVGRRRRAGGCRRGLLLGGE